MVILAIQRFWEWAASERGRRQFILALVLWNVLLFAWASFKPLTGSIQARRDASGFSHELAQRFHYFHFYTGHFPLVTLQDSVEYSKAGAELQIAEHGADLAMEHKHWSRLGEHARIWAYLPNAWLTGSAESPSIRLFNVLFFLCGSIVLFLGSCRADLQRAGVVFVGLVNLTPFFWYEVHSRENIFGLQASLYMIVTGLLVAGLVKRTSPIRWCISVAIGAAAIAFGAELRNEVVSVMACLLAMVLFADRAWWMKGLGIAVAILVFIGGRSMIRAHFDRSWDAAYALVVKHGGHPYTGDRIPGHKFWHPMFCGLGDFGSDKGYAWDDRVAYHYATPILNERYAMDLRYSGAYHTDNYYDADSLYYVKFDEIQAYEDLMKEKVTGDTSADPAWYMGILLQRVLRTLTVTLPFKFAGWLLFPALWLAWHRKAFVHLILIGAALPLSATPILIHSGFGATYVSLFAYPAVVYLLLLVMERMAKRTRTVA